MELRAKTPALLGTFGRTDFRSSGVSFYPRTTCGKTRN